MDRLFQTIEREAFLGVKPASIRRLNASACLPGSSTGFRPWHASGNLGCAEASLI